MLRVKNMNEKILGYSTEYFQMNDFFKKFYEMIFTNERIIIVNSGETFRSWIARADVGHKKREKLVNMDLEDIFNNFGDKEIESIYYKDIREIKLTSKSFIKNGKIHIRLDENNRVFYTNEEDSIKEFKEILNENNIQVNVNLN